MRQLARWSLTLACVAPLWGQEVSVHLNPNQAAKGESVLLELRIQNAKSIEAVHVPDMPPNVQIVEQGAFQTVSVRATPQGMQTLRQVVYRYRVASEQAGTYTIGPFVVEIDQQKYRTQPTQLRVSDQAPAPGKASTALNPWPTTQAYTLAPVAKVYAVFGAKSDLKNVYRNQRVDLDLYLYSRSSNALLAHLKMLTPFHGEQLDLYDLSSNMGKQAVTQRIQNGERVYITKAGSSILFPLEIGETKIEGPVFELRYPNNLVQKVAAHQILLQSHAIGKEVGLSYIGDVLRVDRRVSKTRMDAGDTVDLTVELMGDGNLQVFSDPYGGVSLSNAFLSRPDTEIQHFTSNGNTLFRATVRYRLTAEQAGQVHIPELTLPYYNNRIQKQSYRIPSITLEVSKAPYHFDAERFATRALKPLAGRAVPLWIERPVFWALLVGLTGLPLGLLLRKRRLAKHAQDKGLQATQQAWKTWNRALEQARAYGNTREALQALQKGLLQFIGIQLGLPHGAGWQGIYQGLQTRGVNGKQLQALQEMNTRLSDLAYGVHRHSYDMDRLLKQAAQLVQDLGLGKSV